VRHMVPSVCGLVSLTSALAAAMVQITCTAQAANEWLRKGDSPGPGTQLSADRIRPVTQRVPQANAKLQRRSVALLTDAEIQKFTGQPSAKASDRRLRAYLVRAVFPTGNPSLDVRWDGRRLDVFARGLGCAPFTKHPIIVFLERPPRQVFVRASAAL
jgi:hypothetical protein